jgi:hypothetical protein
LILSARGLAPSAWLENCGQQDLVEGLRYVDRLNDNHLVQRGLTAAGTNGGRHTSAYTLQSCKEKYLT